jgi:hypothetical protein
MSLKMYACAIIIGLASICSFAAPTLNAWTPTTLSVTGITVTTDLGDGKPQRAYIYCSDGYVYLFEIVNSAQEAMYASATSAFLKTKHIGVFPVSQNSTGATNEYYITRLYLGN